MFTKLTFHEISLAHGSALVSPLRPLMKNLKFKLAERDPRLRMVQRTIWGVIRLIAVGIRAPLTGRGLEHGE